MKVNFDRFRKVGVQAYNSLCEKFKEHTDCDCYGGGIKLVRNEVIKIDIDLIRGDMEDLRNCLVTLTSLEDKENGIECLDIPISVFADEEE